MKKHWTAFFLALALCGVTWAGDVTFDGSVIFQCVNSGPPFGNNTVGIACRNTGEQVQSQALILRGKSYHFETLTSNGIKSGLIIDENSQAWIGQDFKGGAFSILDRLEVDGAMAVGTGFTGSNSTVNAPSNGLAVQGDVGVGTKTVTAYGGGSRNLVVQSGANANMQLIQGSGSGVAVMQMNSSRLEISTQTNHPITIAPNGTNRVYVNPDGSLRLPAYANCTLKTDASGNVYCG